MKNSKKEELRKLNIYRTKNILPVLWSLFFIISSLNIAYSSNINIEKTDKKIFKTKTSEELNKEIKDLVFNKQKVLKKELSDLQLTLECKKSAADLLYGKGLTKEYNYEKNQLNNNLQELNVGINYINDLYNNFIDYNIAINNLLDKRNKMSENILSNEKKLENDSNIDNNTKRKIIEEIKVDKINLDAINKDLKKEQKKYQKEFNINNDFIEETIEKSDFLKNIIEKYFKEENKYLAMGENELISEYSNFTKNNGNKKDSFYNCLYNVFDDFFAKIAIEKDYLILLQELIKNGFNRKRWLLREKTDRAYINYSLLKYAKECKSEKCLKFLNEQDNSIKKDEMENTELPKNESVATNTEKLSKEDLEWQEAYKYIKEGKLGKLHELVKQGKDLSKMYYKEEPAPCIAVNFNQYYILRYLINSFDCKNLINQQNGQNALFYSLKKSKNIQQYSDREKMAKLMLENGFDPNSTDYSGKTPIFYDDCYLRLFLNYGADLNWVDNDGNTPLNCFLEKTSLTERNLNYVASRDNLKNIINQITNFRSSSNLKGQNLLHVTIEKQYYDIANVLALKGVDPNQQDINGDTPMHYLARITTFADAKEINPRKILFDKKAYSDYYAYLLLYNVKDKIDLKIKNNKGQTPLDINPTTNIFAKYPKNYKPESLKIDRFRCGTIEVTRRYKQKKREEFKTTYPAFFKEDSTEEELLAEFDKFYNDYFGTNDETKEEIEYNNYSKKYPQKNPKKFDKSEKEKEFFRFFYAFKESLINTALTKDYDKFLEKLESEKYYLKDEQILSIYYYHHEIYQYAKEIARKNKYDSQKEERLMLDRYDQKKLISAVEKGSLKCLKLFWKKRYNIFTTNDDGENMLLLAIKNKSYDVATFLIQLGENIENLSCLLDS